MLKETDLARDPIMIDATLNCLGILIRGRPAIANKILAAVLNFNPLQQASATMTPRLTIIFKSMERTTRALLRFVMRSMPGHPLEQKMQAYLSRLQQSRTSFFSDSPSLKRPAEPTDGLDDAKRQRLTTNQHKFPPMPPSPNSIAQLFTLTQDPAIQQFDVKYLPLELIDFTIPLLLKSVPHEQLEEACNAVRSRFNHITKASLPTPVPDLPMAGPTGIDDEDEYDPDFDLGADSAATTTEKGLEEFLQPAIELGAFKLPKPPPLTGTELSIVSAQSVDHVFGVISTLEGVAAPARQQLGLNRHAASANDRDAWITILVRLATRTPSSIDEYDASAEDADPDKSDDESSIVKSDSDDSEAPTVANRIRHRLFMYILDDFRRHLNVAISWLNEEWYCDQMAAKSKENKGHTPNYDRWSLRLLDRLLPYLDARDKNILIRFLSEIPAINKDLLQSVASLARDPERLSMLILAMQYLIMMRPPVRQIVLDTLEDVWREGDAQVKGAVGKVLAKWRPQVLQSGQDVIMKKEESDGKSPAVQEEQGRIDGKSGCAGDDEAGGQRRRWLRFVS